MQDEPLAAKSGVSWARQSRNAELLRDWLRHPAFWRSRVFMFVTGFY